MIWQPRSSVPWTPVALSALLAGGVILQAVLPWETDLPPPPPPARAAALMPPPQLEKLGEKIDIRRRTMFAPNRSYFAEGVGGATAAGSSGGVAAAGGDPLAGLTLIGAARTRSSAYGVFRDPAGRNRRLRLGEMYEGWRVVALDRDRAVLARPGFRRTLKLGIPVSAGTPAEATMVAINDDQGEEDEE